MHTPFYFKYRWHTVLAVAIFFAGILLVLSPYGAALKETLTNTQQSVVTQLSSEEPTSLSQKESAAYWRARIESVGGARAYEEFHTAYASLDPNEQHTFAHVFGGELYRGEGVDGFSVCDLQYSYGCYHEFLGQAIFEEGIPVVEKLNQGCYDDLSASGQELSCQHGIGHGILAAVGYETDTLTEALEACRDLPYNDPIGGCYGGVFMEYNLRTMLSLDGVPVREKEVSDLHEPCGSMPPYAQSACYYWHPQWWLTVLDDEGYASRVSQHAKMGELCDELGFGDLRDTCLEGIGNNIITTGITPREAIELCEVAGSDMRAEVLCRADAANSFHAMPELRDEAPDVCEGLDGTYYQYCYAHSINQMNILNRAEI